MCVRHRWRHREAKERARFKAGMSEWRKRPNMTLNVAISWPLSLLLSLKNSAFKILIKICLLSHPKWHLTTLVIFQLTAITFLWRNGFAGAQVTSERVSHELSGAIWKQNGLKREKKGRVVQSFTPECFVSPRQLKLNVLRSLLREFIPFLIQTTTNI